MASRHTVNYDGKRKEEITDQMKSVSLGVSGSLANSNESNQGGHVEVDFDTSTLDTNDHSIGMNSRTTQVRMFRATHIALRMSLP